MKSENFLGEFTKPTVKYYLTVRLVADLMSRQLVRIPYKFELGNY
jgi:hypothetical protein